MRYTPRYKQAREELGWSRAELAGKWVWIHLLSGTGNPEKGS